MDIENNVSAPETAEAEIQNEQTLPDGEADARFIKMTLDSGIAPLETRYSQINSCYEKLPVAYRSYTYVNSVVEGVVSPEKYSYASDETEVGVRLASYNIKSAMKAIEQFILAGRKFEFVSVRIPPRMVLETDFYGAIKAILDQYGFNFPDKLCLEFPRTVLFEDEEKARMAILSMKLLKVKTMMSGCGEKDSPITPLVNLPFDYLLLSPFITSLSASREKSVTAAALIAFLKGLPAEIIADGVVSDDQITALSRAGCFGYIPSSNYSGGVTHGRLRMPLEEAVAQKDEVEY
ncbi:MAG: EAL domain-containing protein [Clostridia bacterium]|nr:EAL domain-containing protein [Clostridia bacterium]